LQEFAGTGRTGRGVLEGVGRDLKELDRISKHLRELEEI
jgi:hypothetical protein